MAKYETKPAPVEVWEVSTTVAPPAWCDGHLHFDEVTGEWSFIQNVCRFDPESGKATPETVLQALEIGDFVKRSPGGCAHWVPRESFLWFHREVEST